VRRAGGTRLHAIGAPERGGGETVKTLGAGVGRAA
jgi:hypothetical protein